MGIAEAVGTVVLALAAMGIVAFIVFSAITILSLRWSPALSGSGIVATLIATLIALWLVMTDIGWDAIHDWVFWVLGVPFLAFGAFVFLTSWMTVLWGFADWFIPWFTGRNSRL